MALKKKMIYMESNRKLLRPSQVLKFLKSPLLLLPEGIYPKEYPSQMDYTPLLCKTVD